MLRKPPPQMGHSGAQYDFFEGFDLDEFQFRAVELMMQERIG